MITRDVALQRLSPSRQDSRSCCVPFRLCCVMMESVWWISHRLPHLWFSGCSIVELLLLSDMNVAVVMLVGSFCPLGFSTVKGTAFLWKPQKFVIVCFAMKTVTFTVAVICHLLMRSHPESFFPFLSVFLCCSHTMLPPPCPTSSGSGLECVFVCVEGFSCDECCVS